jgi:hypothetical protein
MDALTPLRFQFAPRAAIHDLYLLPSIGPGFMFVLANTLVAVTVSILQHP